MRKRPFLVLVGILIAGLGFWGWRVFFPSPERAVRNRLLELARLATFGANEAPLARLANAQKLVNFFAEDADIRVDAGGGNMQTLKGRDEMFQTAVAVRNAAGAMTIEFFDLNVAIGPDRKSADVDLTARIRVPSDRDMIVQELRVALKKRGREWFIKRVETVKTLSSLEGDPCCRSALENNRDSGRHV
jgi:hypothetical protein